MQVINHLLKKTIAGYNFVNSGEPVTARTRPMLRDPSGNAFRTENVLARKLPDNHTRKETSYRERKGSNLNATQPQLASTGKKKERKIREKIG